MPQAADMSNVERVLERFAHNVALNARRALQAKRKKTSINATWTKEGGEWRPLEVRKKSFLGNTVASGRLAASLTGKRTARGVLFEMEYYGYWIDQGRKPSVKFPPPLAMSQWIKDKKLRLRDPETGRYMKQTPAARKAAAFLIARKIKAFGIPATGFFSAPFLRAYDKLPYEIQDALLLDADILIEKLNKQ